MILGVSLFAWSVTICLFSSLFSFGLGCICLMLVFGRVLAVNGAVYSQQVVIYTTETNTRWIVLREEYKDCIVAGIRVTD